MSTTTEATAAATTPAAARLLLDNAGGITLQLSGFAATVWDGAEAARLLLDYLDAGDTAGWDGHDDAAAALDPAPGDVGYTILALGDIARALDAEEEPQWGNAALSMLAALRGEELIAIVSEDGDGPAYGLGRGEAAAWADAETWGVTDCDGLMVARLTPGSWIRVKLGNPDAWTIAM